MGKKTKNIRNVCISDFYCTCCGNKGMPIFRTIGSEREAGHLKKLFCLYCQRETNMAEIKQKGKYTLDNFLIEYNGHNFDEQGNRKEDWKIFCKRSGNNE